MNKEMKEGFEEKESDPSDLLNIENVSFLNLASFNLTQIVIILKKNSTRYLVDKIDK